MKRRERECGKKVDAIDILQREKLNKEIMKEIGEKEIENIFGWVKKIIAKQQHNEKYSYLGKKLSFFLMT